MKIRFENGYEEAVKWIENQEEMKKEQASKLTKEDIPEFMIASVISMLLNTSISLLINALCKSIFSTTISVVVTVCFFIVGFLFYETLYKIALINDKKEEVNYWKEKQSAMLEDLQKLSSKDVRLLYDTDLTPYSFFYEEEKDGNTLIINFDIWSDCNFVLSEKDEIVWKEGTVTVFGKCYNKCEDCDYFKDEKCSNYL